MKALILITTIMAIAVGVPVPQDQEREKRSVSDSDELSVQFYEPPYGYPFGTYPSFPNQAYPWPRYCLFPVPIPLSDSLSTPPPNRN
ncbi:follicular dendritic cell secreted peptide [Marmota marmota marmota]|uniref:follicular dendritic cell secreted peptide n=1 Tax=Marmota marmota marmota TaxID=9994 RepID=UPI0020929AED|nr:follicular dendritic cell secreted peptide [Marmota marmota marmota]